MGIANLIDDFITSELEDSPVRASALGAPGYDHLLGDYSAPGMEAKADRAARWLERFEALDEADLDHDERIDRDLIVATLRGRAIMRDWAVWKRDPSTYLGPGLSGVFTLFLNRLHDDAHLTEAAAARLDAVPEVLAEGKRNLDRGLASPVFVQRGLGQCAAGVRYCRDLVPTEVSDPAHRRRLADAGAAAAAAYEDFAAFLDGFDANGPYAIGEQRYSGLLLDKEALGYDTAQMVERGRRVYDELATEMVEMAERITGDADWVAAVVDLSQRHPDTPDGVRDAYDAWTRRSRDFLAERELVTFPDGETCRVVPSPPFQRPVLAVASYSPPPAFTASVTGHFFVPYPPDGASPEEVQQRLSSNSELSIPTTAVHEAYPGHHWHFAALSEQPRRIRKMLGTSYFIEGWALYTERMMREEGFYDDPVHEFGMLHARIFRAARIIVDTSLHTGEMSFDEAWDFMQTKAGMARPTARAEVARYCAAPTQAPSYLTGALEIERMRERYLGSGGDLRSFHDRLARSGMLPIGVAERALFDG